jgi:hypothetical protein
MSGGYLNALMPQGLLGFSDIFCCQLGTDKVDRVQRHLDNDETGAYNKKETNW